MNVLHILNGLNEQVKQTFQSSFIFIVSPEKVQHFPIRGWSDEQILEKIRGLLSESFETTVWNNYLVCYNLHHQKVLIIPKYNSPSDLQ